ncbi:MAG: glycosyltransferase family 39 protein [Nitrospirae bacterium]|nr:glycosyltransferase family 39 protein [Nitrospirota bacterium]
MVKRITSLLDTVGLLNLILYFILSIYTVFMLFYNLNTRYYWLDETETAALAVNILKHGLPRVYDGKNYISLYGPGVSENKSNIATWRPWLDEYIVAASFKIIGQSNRAGRIPFVLFAAVTVVLTALFSYRVFKSHEAALMAILLLVTSELFILHARQCRYYSLIIFAEVCLIFAAYLLLKGKKSKGIVVLTISLVIQFYTNYIVLAGNIVALGMFAVFTGKRNKGLFSSVLISFTVLLITAMPWLIYAKPWHQAGFVGGWNPVSKLKYYFIEIHFHIIPLVLFLIPLVYYFLRRFYTNGVFTQAQRVSTVVKDIVLLSLLIISASLLFVPFAPWVYIRYVVHFLPVTVFLTVFILTTYVRFVWLRVLLVCFMCFTNYISYFSAYPVRALKGQAVAVHEPKATIISLIHYVTADSTDRLEDIAEYLNKDGTPNDTVLVSCPEFQLAYYTGMRVVNARFLEMFDFDSLPQWILPECVSEDTTVPLYPPAKYARYYRPVSVGSHDSPVVGNMPNPDIYDQFSDKGKSYITVYKLQLSKPDSIKPDMSVFKPSGFDGGVNSVAVTPNGKYVVAAGGWDNIIKSKFSIKLIDIESGALVREFAYNPQPIKSLNVMTDGSSVTGVLGNTIIQWDITTGNKIKSFIGHKERINTIALTPDGKHLLSSARNDSLKVWDVHTSKEIRSFNALKNKALTIAITPDGRYAVSAGTDNLLRLWDIKTGVEIKTFSGNTEDIKNITISKNGKYMITSGGCDGTIKMWNIVNGDEIKTNLGQANAVSSFAMTPDGKMVVVGSWDGTVSVWDLASEVKVKTFSTTFKTGVRDNE